MNRTLPLMAFHEFDFSQLKTSGITRLFPRLLPVGPWRNGTLIVRLRDVNIGAAGSFVDVSLVAEAPDPTDPAALYRNLNLSFGLTSILGPISGGALLYTTALTTDSVPLPSWVRLRIIARQQTVDTALSFTMGVDVALHD